jgi:hypothetical protein
MTPPRHAAQDRLAIIREMVRLAENRRTEAIGRLEKINQYNLAMIGFSGTFLSLLVTAEFPIAIVRVAGLSLIASIGVALCNISPKPLKGATLLIDEDVYALRRGEDAGPFADYLLSVADLTEAAATVIHKRASVKKRWMTMSAIFLAFSLISTYILYAYA